jgi:hypothetical protein
MVMFLIGGSSRTVGCNQQKSLHQLGMRAVRRAFDSPTSAI